MRTWVCALLTIGAATDAGAATVDDVCRVVAAQESAEAWPGVDAREDGLPPGAAQVIVGALCEASPEVAMSAGDLALISDALVLIERPATEETALAPETLPAGSAEVFRLALARVTTAATIAEQQERLRQIDARLP